MKLLVKLYGDKWSWKNIWRRATCRKPIPKRQKPKVGNFALPTGEIVTYEDYVKQMGETPDLLEARPLGWDENKEERRVNKKTRKELFRSLYLAGIGFFLFSYGYHQLSLMQNYLHESEFFMEIKYMPDYMNTYGHVQLLAKYGLAALLGVLVPYLTRVVQDKWILFVGAGGYGLFISLSFLDAKYTIMPSGFLAGLASTPFFTTFSMYMVQLTKRLGDLNQKRPYNGIQSNWMLYILNTFVFGGWFLGYSLSAMTCTVLVFGDMQRNYTYIHTNNLSCGRYHCDKPWPNWWDTMMQEKDIPSIDKYSNANLANACCLILVMGFFLFGCLEGQTTKIWSNLKEKGFELNFKLGFRGVFSWRRTMLAPTFIFMGWATDFIAYTYPKAYTICSLNSWLHYVALAACGFMGSVVAAGAPWLALKRTGWNPILIVAVSCFFICLVILIPWTPVASIGGFKYTNVFPAIWEKILFVAVPALWGLGSGALYAAVNVKIQFEYPEPDEMIQMFVLFYHWHAVGVLVGYATRSTATCTGPKLYGLLGTLVLAIVMYVWYEHKRLKQEDALKAEDVKVIRFIPNPHPDKMANESDVEEEGTSTSEEETDDEGNRKKRKEIRYKRVLPPNDPRLSQAWKTPYIPPDLEIPRKYITPDGNIMIMPKHAKPPFEVQDAFDSNLLRGTNVERASQAARKVPYHLGYGGKALFYDVEKLLEDERETFPCKFDAYGKILEGMENEPDFNEDDLASNADHNVPGRFEEPLRALAEKREADRQEEEERQNEQRRAAESRDRSHRASQPENRSRRRGQSTSSMRDALLTD